MSLALSSGSKPALVAGHHPILHVANAALALPIAGLLTGWFAGLIPILAALAAFVLYSLQIYDWLKAHRGTDDTSRKD